MTTLNPSYKDTHGQQNSSNNPALNDQAFDRAVARAGEKGKTGMTAVGAYVKTALLLVILLAAAVWGYRQVEVVEVMGRQQAIQPSWTFLAFLLTFIFGVAGIFAGRFIPFIAIGYALAEGALLGSAAHYYDLVYDGIVSQAIIATLAVFIATWILYMVGVLKATNKLAMFVIVGMAAIMITWLLAWFLSLFGINFRFLNEPTPLGIAFAVLTVVLGALNLPLDFEFIKRASAAGAPKFMEWYGAYGLMLSIIWMYVSILRLLALLRGR